LHNCERFGQLYRGCVPQKPITSHRSHGRSHVSRFVLAGWWSWWRCLCPVGHSDHLIVHHKWELSCQCARSSSTFPVAPMGKVLTCLFRDSRLHNCERFGQLQEVRATETLKSSQRPVGRLTFCSLLQGGGVHTGYGIVSIENSQISSNTAISVRADVRNFPSPHGKIARFT